MLPNGRPDTQTELLMDVLSVPIRHLAASQPLLPGYIQQSGLPLFCPISCMTYAEIYI